MMLGLILHVAVAAVTLLVSSVAAHADFARVDCAAHDAEVAEGKIVPKRIALSIGNAANLGTPLVNAVNDSTIVATTLREQGWEVVHKGDLDRKQMVDALDQFAARVRQLCPADVALFYFAGYGFEIDRVSYIFPTDLNEELKYQAMSEAKQDAYLQGAISLKAIMAALAEHKGPKVIILDTCRDNPFEGRRRKLDDELLAAVRLPDNTLYAYSAEPGDIALDAGPNPDYGPYAWALARAIREVDGTAEQAFRRVRLEVVGFSSQQLTGQRKPNGEPYQQRPFVESSLSSDVHLGKLPARQAPAAAQREQPAGPAQSRRIALVIANADYETAGTLSNPGNDAKAIAERLRRVGFEVIQKTDVKQADLEVALLEFGKRARRSDWAIVYYAGHGMEIGGRTYLLPTDVRLQRDVDADDEAVRLDRVIEKVERTEGIGLIVLDACRNNPFERSMRRMGRRGRDAQTSVGLGRVDIDHAGVLVAYSAKHGTVARDGDEGGLSPFAEALVGTIEQPGLEIGMVFRKVRDQVYAKTDREQEPYFYGTLPGREFFFVPAPR